MFRYELSQKSPRALHVLNNSPHRSLTQQTQHPPNIYQCQHDILHDMHRRPGSLTEMDQDGETTANGAGKPKAKHLAPVSIPSEIPILSVRRYLRAFQNNRKNRQWGIQFDTTRCAGYTEPPLELLGLVNILPSLMHVHFIVSEVTHPPLVGLRAAQIFVCQVVGVSRLETFGPVVVPDKHSLLLPSGIFPRLSVCIRPLTQTS